MNVYEELVAYRSAQQILLVVGVAVTSFMVLFILFWTYAEIMICVKRKHQAIEKVRNKMDGIELGIKKTSATSGRRHHSRKYKPNFVNYKDAKMMTRQNENRPSIVVELMETDNLINEKDRKDEGILNLPDRSKFLRITIDEETDQDDHSDQ